MYMLLLNHCTFLCFNCFCLCMYLFSIRATICNKFIVIFIVACAAAPQKIHQNSLTTFSVYPGNRQTPVSGCNYFLSCSFVVCHFMFTVIYLIFHKSYSYRGYFIYYAFVVYVFAALANTKYSISRRHIRQAIKKTKTGSRNQC